jgi:predicted DNA-binding transcriptional regulator AlpA
MAIRLEDMRRRLTQDGDVLLMKKEAAVLLDIGESTLDEYARKGGGPERVKVGGKVRYALSELVRWVEAAMTETRRQRKPMSAPAPKPAAASTPNNTLPPRRIIWITPGCLWSGTGDPLVIGGVLLNPGKVVPDSVPRALAERWVATGQARYEADAEYLVRLYEAGKVRIAA